MGWRCKSGLRKRKLSFWISLCFHIFHMCRNSLSTKMLSFYNRLKTRALDVQEKNVKAREVAEAARGLRSELTAFRGNEFVNYYLHCAIAHLPEQIRMCPVDIFDASGCAIEHLHIDVKRNLL